MTTPTRCLLAAMVLAALAGCSAAPAPQGSTPPPAPLPAAAPNIVSGAPDTAEAVPGSANSPYVFRFKQVEPGSSTFNFRDRDLSFWFKPSPTALTFRVENLQGRPVQIDWDHCTFYDVDGRSGKPAHGTTRWRDRFSPLASTMIGGLQQYGDYMFPMDYLVDPGAAAGPDDQPHRPIVPEDQSAPTYSGRTFGVDLVFLIDDRPRTYSFRFQVASVIPR